MELLEKRASRKKQAQRLPWWSCYWKELEEWAMYRMLLWWTCWRNKEVERTTHSAASMDILKRNQKKIMIGTAISSTKRRTSWKCQKVSAAMLEMLENGTSVRKTLCLYGRCNVKEQWKEPCRQCCYDRATRQRDGGKSPCTQSCHEVAATVRRQLKEPWTQFCHNGDSRERISGKKLVDSAAMRKLVKIWDSWKNPGHNTVIMNLRERGGSGDAK